MFMLFIFSVNCWAGVDFTSLNAYALDVKMRHFEAMFYNEPQSTGAAIIWMREVVGDDPYWSQELNSFESALKDHKRDEAQEILERMKYSTPYVIREQIHDLQQWLDVRMAKMLKESEAGITAENTEKYWEEMQERLRFFKSGLDFQFIPAYQIYVEFESDVILELYLLFSDELTEPRWLKIKNRLNEFDAQLASSPSSAGAMIYIGSSAKRETPYDK